MLTTAIIDDHPVSLAFLEHMLRAEGLTPIRGSSGAEAMRLANEQRIDIWFVDWVMPGMNGVDLVRAIRARPDGAHAYIIMLTSKGSEEDLATAFEAGVDDFIRKPFGAIEFRARLGAAKRVASMTKALQERLGQINALNAQLEELASTDAITGLLNRRAAIQRLSDVWEQATRYGRPLSLAIVDIDHFKRVNDTFGHARGDAAIRFVASALKDTTRSSDIVARIGGEEFLVVLPETTVSGAEAVLERARAAVSKARCIADGKELNLSISVGVAELDDKTPSFEMLMQYADQALYAAKDAGRNRVVSAMRQAA